MGKRAMTHGRKPGAPGRFLPGTMILLGSLMLGGCERAPPAGGPAPPAAPNPPASATPAAGAAAAQPEPYRASGPIVVENQVDVSAQREGMVTGILADVGELVH